MRLGRLTGGARGPGMFFVLPCTDTYTPVDLRVKTFDVPPQEVLTKDSVTIHVNAVVYFRVSDPIKAVLNVENYVESTKLLSQTTLRSVIGSKDLQQLLVQRDQVSQNLRHIMDVATDPWGVKVDRVEIKDIILPHSLQRAMAAEAEATREANAKVIAASGEKRAAKNLAQASDVMAASPGAMQLRYMQTLNTIAAEKNSTIVFPLPIELLSAVSGIRKVAPALKKLISSEESDDEVLDLDHGEEPVVVKKKKTDGEELFIEKTDEKKNK